MDEFYTQEGTINKEILWEKHQYLVRREALRLQARLPPSVELDDLIQAGAIGLLNAIEQFDAHKSTSLSSFFSYRIRWALIDELRERDWVPRRIRANGRDIAATIGTLEQRKGGIVSESEIAASMGVSLQEYQQMLMESNFSQIFSLDEIQETFCESTYALALESVDSDPANLLMAQNLKQQISDKIKSLSEREQQLLSLYYHEELNMKEIAKIFDITEARVSQLHSQAVKRLKSRIDSI